MRHHKNRTTRPDPFSAYVAAFRASPTEYDKALRAARRRRKLLDKRWSTGGPFNAGRKEGE